MSLINLSMIHSGLDSVIRRSNAVVVNRRPGEVSLLNITEYLRQYDNSEIRRAELIETSELGSKYKLENAGPITFNLMIFVNEMFTLEDENIAQNYLGIGYIQMPTLGSEKLNPEIYLDIEWNIIDNEASIHFTSDLHSTPDVLLNNYTEPKGSPFGDFDMMSKSDSGSYGINFVPSTENTPSGITFVPQGILNDNTLHKVPLIDIDCSDFPEEVFVMDTTYINYRSKEWVEFLMSDGSKLLRNVTDYPAEPLLDTPYDALTNTWKVELEPTIKSLLTPDRVLWKSGNRWRSISSEDYHSNGYTKLSDIEVTVESFKEHPINLAAGIDRFSDEINVIFSDRTKVDDWFLQSKYSTILSRSNYVNSLVFKYIVREHNNRFFVITETSNSYSTEFILDHLGNRLSGATYYKLLIDGSLFCKVGEELRYYETDFREAHIMKNTSEIYGIYPSLYSKNILNNSPIDFKKFILVRDRFQDLFYEQEATVTRAQL